MLNLGSLCTVEVIQGKEYTGTGVRMYRLSSEYILKYMFLLKNPHFLSHQNEVYMIGSF